MGIVSELPPASPFTRARAFVTSRESPHPPTSAMGTYKKSSTWSKDGDQQRDAAVRAMASNSGFLAPGEKNYESVQVVWQCSLPMKGSDLEIVKALTDFIATGLDDLDGSAVSNASLGAKLARAGVQSNDYDKLLEGVLIEASTKCGADFDAIGRQLWASGVDLFCGQCKQGAPALETPKSALITPKPKKKSYTGGLYKKFQIGMGKKKAPETVKFNLEESNSIASPGPGPAVQEKGAVGGGQGASRFTGNSSNSTPIKHGPVPAVQPRSRRKVLQSLKRDTGFERVFSALFWVVIASMVGLLTKRPEVTAEYTRQALYLGREKFLALLVLAFFLRPITFARRGFWVAVFVAAKTILGYGYSIQSAKDPWGSVVQPVLCTVPKVCDNGLVTWMKLVAVGK